MALTATPLSYNWTIKEVIDEIRSLTKEEDEQVSSDDNIRAHAQWAIHNMFKMSPAIRSEYLVDVPFVVDTTASPMVSTLVRPTTSATALPIKVISAPQTSTPTVPTPDGTTGIYDFHYEHPTNFIIQGWKDVWNELTGTCRRTSDFSQLMGHCLNGNTQLARTVAWWNDGRQLWVSVREGMVKGSANVIVHGIGWRTPIKLIELAVSTVPTSAPEDHTESELDETVRYIPKVNDWDLIDCPDDYVPMVINLAAIKVWGQVGKLSKEQESVQLEQAYGQFFESTEAALAQRDSYRRQQQYQDR